jgi:ribonuclease HI
LGREKSIYIVIRGIHPGVYFTWSGKDGAEAQVKGYQDALYKGFVTEAEAVRWLQSLKIPTSRLPREISRLLEGERQVSKVENQMQAIQEAGKVALFTDGACIRNPGPGGYGAVLLHAGRRKEISGGYRRTTNNRMELMACIMGLKQLKRSSRVVIFSDSKYVVDSISTGKTARWQSAGWQRSGGQKVENTDLWEDLLKLCAVHQVEFLWIKGHAEYAENMRCDALAVKAARESAAAVDAGFER